MATFSIEGGVKTTAAVFAAPSSAVLSAASNALRAASPTHPFSGHDTINVGVGSDTIFETGSATVHGLFGAASLAGGSSAFVNAGNLHAEIALSGKETLMGGALNHEFVGGAAVMKGAMGGDLLASGKGVDTLSGAAKTLFEFAGGGQHVITNFVAGKDQLYLEGQSLSYLQQHHDITVKGGNTYISLDGGKTTVELHGVTGLKSSDISTHKP